MEPLVLLTDPDPAYCRAIRQHLLADGFSVAVANDAASTLLLVAEAPPVAMVLSWDLPDTSGIELCRQFRRLRSTRATPLVMVSDHDDDDHCVRALTTGADDFMVKPVSNRVLSARLRRVIHRCNPNVTVEIMRAAGIELNRMTGRVSFDREEVRLGATEYRLLQFFMTYPGRIHTRESLLDNVWGDNAEANERTVDVHVGRLRKIMRRCGLADPIWTVRGGGYAFQDE